MPESHDQAASDAAPSPSKKTVACKEPIKPHDHNEIVAMLRQELDEAYERIHLLKKELGAEVQDIPALGLRHTPARIFSVLMAKSSVPVSSLLNIIYADRAAERDIPSIETIKVFVWTLRNKLKPYGIEIETVWGEGWRMTEANKAKARKIIDGRPS